MQSVSWSFVIIISIDFIKLNLWCHLILLNQMYIVCACVYIVDT